MQEAFQLGAASWEKDLDEEILPESHIDKSLNAKGSIAYKAVVDGQMCGGAIVIIDGSHGHLDFLYVKNEIQSKCTRVVTLKNFTEGKIIQRANASGRCYL